MKHEYEFIQPAVAISRLIFRLDREGWVAYLGCCVTPGFSATHYSNHKFSNCRPWSQCSAADGILLKIETRIYGYHGIPTCYMNLVSFETMRILNLRLTTRFKHIFSSWELCVKNIPVPPYGFLYGKSRVYYETVKPDFPRQ